MDFEGWGGINKGRLKGSAGVKEAPRSKIYAFGVLVGPGSSRTNLDRPVIK